MACDKNYYDNDREGGFESIRCNSAIDNEIKTECVRECVSTAKRRYRTMAEQSKQRDIPD